MRPGLSRAGWLTLAAAIALSVAGRFLGLTELFVMGGVVLALVVVCRVLAALSRPRLLVARVVSPARVHVGTRARVELTITNVGRFRSPVVSLADPVTGTTGAEVLLAPLAAHQSTSAAYQLPTEERGLIRVGPLKVVTSDPFGLTRLPSSGADLAELTVLPRLQTVVPLASSTGDDPHGGVPRATLPGRTGEEFHALRPYVVGDDLRRVHWASTARTGDLMVRQDELPWQGRTTVLVDLRSATTTPESLERIISAAASILDASWKRRDLVRLLTTDGTDSGFAAGRAHVDAVMEHLAVVGASEADNLAALARVFDQAVGGGLVAVLGAAGPADLDRLAAPRSGYRSVSLVSFRPGPVAPAERAALRSATAVGGNRSTDGLLVGDDEDFAELWNQAMGGFGADRSPTPASGISRLVSS